MQALVYRGDDGGPALDQIPIPAAVPGSAVVRVLAALLSPNARNVYSGAWGPITPDAPFTLSGPAIARIHRVGEDATALESGQLVFVDQHVTARDSPDASLLQGYMVFGAAGGDTGNSSNNNNSSRRLADAHRHGTFAEYARVPLENVHVLDEELLCGRLGYGAGDLLQLADCAIATAALANVCEFRAGSTAIVAPATGRFDGCLVQVALAMGAGRVVAAGRTASKVAEVAQRYNAAAAAATNRVVAAVLTGDEAKDTQTLSDAVRGGSGGGQGADAFLDMSPTGAKVSHIASCISALRDGGSAALVGGDVGSVSIPYLTMMQKQIRLQGSKMFTRDNVRQTIRLVESGLLGIGSRAEGGMKVQGFGLADLDKAYQANEAHPGFGNIVYLEP